MIGREGERGGGRGSEKEGFQRESLPGYDDDRKNSRKELCPKETLPRKSKSASSTVKCLPGGKVNPNTL